MADTRTDNHVHTTHTHTIDALLICSFLSRRHTECVYPNECIQRIRVPHTNTHTHHGLCCSVIVIVVAHMSRKRAHSRKTRLCKHAHCRYPKSCIIIYNMHMLTRTHAVLGHVLLVRPPECCWHTNSTASKCSFTPMLRPVFCCVCRQTIKRWQFSLCVRSRRSTPRHATPLDTRTRQQEEDTHDTHGCTP